MLSLRSPIPDASATIASLRTRHAQLISSIARFEARVAKQTGQLAKMNRSLSYDNSLDDEENPAAESLAEKIDIAPNASGDYQITVEDIRLEEAEIRELEKKKRALEDRVNGRSLCLSSSSTKEAFSSVLRHLICQIFLDYPILSWTLSGFVPANFGIMQAWREIWVACGDEHMFSLLPVLKYCEIHSRLQLFDGFAGLANGLISHSRSHQEPTKYLKTNERRVSNRISIPRPEMLEDPVKKF